MRSNARAGASRGLAVAAGLSMAALPEAARLPVCWHMPGREVPLAAKYSANKVENKHEQAQKARDENAHRLTVKMVYG